MAEANPFDQFDPPAARAANPFDQFDHAPASAPMVQLSPSTRAIVGAVKQGYGDEAFPSILSPEAQRSLETSDYPVNRFINAPLARVVGTGAAALSGGFRGLQEGVAQIGEAVGAPVLGRDIAAMPEALAGGGPHLTVRPLVEDMRAAGADAARPPLPTKAEAVVAKRLKQDLEASGKTPEEIAAELEKARALGKPVTLMDVAGTKGNIQGLAGKVAREPGESKGIVSTFMDERDKAAGARTKEDVARDLGTGPSARRTVQGLIQTQSIEGNALYEKAYEGGSMAPLQRQFEVAFDDASIASRDAAGELQSARNELTQAQARLSQAGDVYSASGANEAVRAAQAAVTKAEQGVARADAEKAQVLEVLRQAQEDGSAGKPGAVWNPRIQQFLDDPTVRRGMARGLEIQRLEALAEGRRFDPTEYAIVGVDQAGEPVVGKVPNMRTLDSIKKGLDAIIQDNRQPDGRLNQYGVAADKARKAFLAEVDRINPDYAAARQNWAGHHASMDAVNLGRNIHRLSPEEIADAVADMAPANLEFLRLGVADNLLERIARTSEGGDEAKALINNEWRRGQLKPVFASEAAFERFVDSVALERLMFETRRAVQGGSDTAPRLAEDGQAVTTGLEAARGIGHFVGGHVLSALGSAARVAKQLGLGRDPKVSAEIARILTSTDMPSRAVLDATKGVNPPP